MDITSLDYKKLTAEERVEYVDKLPSNLEWAQGLILGDEWANSLTHALGLVLSFIGGAYLVMNAWTEDNQEKVVALSIYGICLILLYATSTLYHAVRHHRLKKLFRTFDHCAIYLCIAGTYTPVTNLVLEKPWGDLLFSLVWGLAFLGICFKMFYTHRFKGLSLCIYIAMGWLIVIAAEPFFNSFPYEGICWIFFGGLSYTLGIIFYLLDKRRFYHAIWHLFVLGGSASHFAAFLYL
jgi:hemolysin III